MEILRLVLRYAHLVGFALLLGGAVAQYLTGTIRMNAAMLWGAGIQVVTGLALAAPLRGGGENEPDPVKRKAIYDQVQAIVADMCPVLECPLHTISVAARNTIGNLKPSILEMRLLWNQDQLYIKSPEDLAANR